METGGNRTGAAASGLRRSVALVHGLPIDRLSLDGAVERIEWFVDQAPTTGRSYRVATVNLDFVVRSAREPGMR